MVYVYSVDWYGSNTFITLGQYYDTTYQIFNFYYIVKYNRNNMI